MKVRGCEDKSLYQVVPHPQPNGAARTTGPAPGRSPPTTQWGCEDDRPGTRSFSTHNPILSGSAIASETYCISDFFPTLIKVFQEKVPPEVEYTGSDSPLPPHLVLAQSLVDVLVQPLKFARHTDAPPSHVGRFIVHQFIIDVASRGNPPGVHDFIMPSLRESHDFPKSKFLALIHSAASDGPSLFPRRIFPNVYLLHSLLHLFSDCAGRNQIVHYTRDITWKRVTSRGSISAA